MDLIRKYKQKAIKRINNKSHHANSEKYTFFIITELANITFFFFFSPFGYMDVTCLVQWKALSSQRTESCFHKAPWWWFTTSFCGSVNLCETGIKCYMITGQERTRCHQPMVRGKASYYYCFGMDMSGFTISETDTLLFFSHLSLSPKNSRGDDFSFCTNASSETAICPLWLVTALASMWL